MGGVGTGARQLRPASASFQRRHSHAAARSQEKSSCTTFGCCIVCEEWRTALANLNALKNASEQFVAQFCGERGGASWMGPMPRFRVESLVQSPRVIVCDVKQQDLVESMFRPRLAIVVPSVWRVQPSVQEPGGDTTNHCA